MVDTTKKCPYCAETIQAEAIVCRYCGRDLKTPSQRPSHAKPKKKSNTLRNLFLVVFGGILLACCGLFVFVSLFPDLPTPDSSGEQSDILPQASNGIEDSSNPAPSPVPTPTQIIAPSAEEIFATVENMTDAQRNAYNDSLDGNQVIGWIGRVSEVNEGEIFGGFTVYVDVLEDNFGSEVFIDVNEEVALSLSLDQLIEFSGTISFVSDTFGTSIHIEDATIMIIE